MRVFAATIGIAVCALLASAAVAAERHRDLDIPKYTAAVLYEECGQPASSVEKAHCNGFVHGFLVGTLTGYDIAGMGTLFCGGSPSVAQVVALFQIFARAHPETLHLEAKVALVAALESAFPCQ
jgi:hypothetical protein